MIIRIENLPDITEPGYPLIMRQVVTRDKAAGLSVTWVQIWGEHPGMRTDEADRVYYVIEGTGSFKVGDEPSGDVAAGDVVLIPRGIPYWFSGDMTYLVMNGPAFRPGSDVLVPPG